MKTFSTHLLKLIIFFSKVFGLTSHRTHCRGTGKVRFYSFKKVRSVGYLKCAVCNGSGCAMSHPYKR